MKYISLFAGIGGFDLALDRLGHTCVWANEWDKYAAQIYNKNFETKEKRVWEGDSQGIRSGENDRNDEGDQGLGSSGAGNEQHINRSTVGQHGIDTRDIRTVPTSEIPDHDLLVGGFPCQAFSIAGKRRGFDDTRGTLFFEIARILKDKQPKFFILENVKGLLSHDGGNTFKTIIATLTELGYDLQWQVLNSKNFGVPQNRERVFIVGHIRGERRPEVFPIRESSEESNRSLGLQGLQQIAGALRATDYKGTHNNVRDVSHTVRSSGRGSRHESKQNWDSYEFNGKIRRLTPIECERLQGFPENEKSVIIEVCTDHLKNSVNAETQNPKSQKSVGSVGKTDSEENALSVGQSMSIKHPQTDKPVHPDVLISCVENGVEILSQGRSILSVNTAIDQNSSVLPIKTEDFVRLIAGLSTIVEKITHSGREELQAKEQSSIVQVAGENYVRLFGNGITPLVSGVKSDSTTLKELTKSITSYPSDLKITDTSLQTWFSCAMTVISGLIPEETLRKSSLTFRLNTKLGYTHGVSDTQRYKCLGNAVTVNVVYEVARKLCLQ